MSYEVNAGLHLGSAMLSLVLGAAIFLLPKGTWLHTRCGYAYVASMIVLNGSALSIYARTGAFGPFHWAAVISGLTLAAGMVPAVRRRPVRGWVALHWEFMSWSFVGLIAAAVAETAFRIPEAPYWPAVVGASALVMLLGGLTIYRAPRPLPLRPPKGPSPDRESSRRDGS